MLFRSRALLTLFSTVCVLGLSACSTPKLYVSPDSSFRPGTDLVLILPTDIHGLAGNRTEKQALLYQSFGDAFGESAIVTEDIQQELSQLGMADLSWQLSHGLYHLVAEHGFFDFALEIDAHSTSKYAAVPARLARLTQYIQRKYHLLEEPDYIALAHIDSMGVADGGENIKYRVIAGIYSRRDERIERLVTYVKKSPNQDLAIRHDLDTLGVLLYRELVED